MTRYAEGWDPTRQGGNRGGPGEEGAIRLTVDANKRESRKQKKIFGDPLGQSNEIYRVNGNTNVK
jgi:hypothetical protein